MTPTEKEPTNERFFRFRFHVTTSHRYTKLSSEEMLFIGGEAARFPPYDSVKLATASPLAAQAVEPLGEAALVQKGCLLGGDLAAQQATRYCNEGRRTIGCYFG